MILFGRTKTNDETADRAMSGLNEDSELPPPAEPAPTGGGLTHADAAVHLQALGLPPNSSWAEVTVAYDRLISDLTPGPDASHSNVALAQKFLVEVNQAYASLRNLAVA